MKESLANCLHHSTLTLVAFIFLLVCCEEKDETPAKEPEKPDTTEIEEPEKVALHELGLIFKGSGSENLNQFDLPLIKFNYPIDSVFQKVTSKGIALHKISIVQFDVLLGGIAIPFDTLINKSSDSLFIIPKQLTNNKVYWEINLEIMVQKLIENEWQEVFSRITKDREVINLSIRSLPLSLEMFPAVDSALFAPNTPLTPFNPDLRIQLRKNTFKDTNTQEKVSKKLRTDFLISIKEDGEPFEFDWEVDSVSNQLTITPKSYLCDCLYEIETAFSYSFYSGKKDIWWPAEELTESYSITFISNEFESTTLQEDNIAYTYPIDRQYFFLPKEYPYGYLQLHHEQPGLLRSIDNDDWQLKFRLSTLDGSFSEIQDMRYHNGYFEYDMNENLKPETIYKGEYFEVSSSGTEVSLYNFHFRTSIHDTFIEKILANKPSSVWFTNPYEGGHRVGNNLYIKTEAFDLAEIKGTAKSDPMLILTNEFDYNTDFKEKFYPLIYEAVEKGFFTIDDNTEHGVPPVNSAFWWQYPYGLKLKDEQIQANEALNFEGIEGTVSILAHVYFAKHYRELLQKAAAHPDQENEFVQRIMDGSSGLRNKNYPYSISYVLPGNKQSHRWMKLPNQ
ncbi:MAG: hypothetical protein RIC30_09575 [Marinoscillum sp.]|uniref:hypothetical protein n=1 Tax=Marinoscillum sp. TaxID=2024838 RepID=UPI0032F834BE